MAKIKLDDKGMREMLNSPALKSSVTTATVQVYSRAKANAKAGGKAVPVVMRYKITTLNGAPRTVGVVSIAHPAGLRIEAKRNTLKGAAQECGLEVTAQSE